MLRLVVGVGLLLVSGFAHAHDTWVETNTNLVRVEDRVHIDLKLGNHGNEHRDFKQAGKLDLEPATLEVIAPDGERYDLKSELLDVGYSPSEGYWTAPFTTGRTGLYCVAHTLDAIPHGKTRSIKSAKTYFVASASLDNVDAEQPGFDTPLGHALELVPIANPVTPMGPGLPIKVRVLYNGQPLPGARVSFVPRGVELKESFDDKYERTADAKGDAKFTPTEGNTVLVVVHHVEPEQAGEGFDKTAYSATLTVFVPQACPCCE